MSVQISAVTPPPAASVTIAFRRRLTLSPHFKALFDEGMGLVEETATYLDGPGRRDAKMLGSPVTIAYATESMRLTTRLMQLASWLLVRRAVNRGEISEEQAASDKHKVTLVPIGRSTRTRGYEELPLRLRELVEASLRLHDRIMRLDRIIHHDARAAYEPAPRAVEGQIDRIRAAFSAPAA